MLKNWIKIYLHQIKNNKFFTALNILGLSIGISGLIFSILYWNDEHSYNDWNPEKEKVFQVLNHLESNDMIWTYNATPIGTYLKTFPEVEDQCFFSPAYINDIIEYKGKKEQIAKIISAQNSFFSFFPFEISKGNRGNIIPDENSIAISEKTAKQLFREEDPIGKQVKYADKILAVKAVYKIQGKSSAAPDAVVNFIDNKLNETKDQWGNFTFGLLIKLKNPAQADAVRKKIDQVAREQRTAKDAKAEGLSIEEYLKKNGDITTILEQLKTAKLHSQTNGYPEFRGNYQFLIIMVGVSILILILSIVNYVNLATANAIKRAKEVGVRKILGASKTNIVKQFITETFITTAFSIFLALMIAELALPYYNDFLEKDLTISGSQFYIQLLFIFVIIIITAGIFPAIYVSNFETLKVIRGNFSRSKSGIWLRNGMLIFQFSIASFFIIGSYIVHQQVDYMNKKDIGFNGNQVLNIFYRGGRNVEEVNLILNKYATVKEELKKIKGVENVSAGAFVFGRNANSSTNFTYKDIHIQGQNMAVDFGMLDMMKIKIVQGRNLTPDLSSDTISSVLINETTMKMMKEKDVLGKEIQWNDKKFKIVGVTNDFNLLGPQNEIPPMIFFHFKNIDWMAYSLNRIYVKIDSENMDETIANIEDFWSKKVDQKYPLEYDFVDKDFARSYQTYVNQRNLFGLLNGIVIMIALFGLFALASYSIERRMKEIAIRKTLGAETKTLLVALSKQYIIFCVIGFLIALFPVYYLLEMWMENFVFRIDISILPFLIGFLTLMILTLTVVISRAYFATRMNVLNYLKYE